jgi:hypothetical protein
MISRHAHSVPAHHETHGHSHVTGNALSHGHTLHMPAKKKPDHHGHDNHRPKKPKHGKPRLVKKPTSTPNATPQAPGSAGGGGGGGGGSAPASAPGGYGAYGAVPSSGGALASWPAPQSTPQPSYPASQPSAGASTPSVVSMPASTPGSQPSFPAPASSANAWALAQQGQAMTMQGAGYPLAPAAPQSPLARLWTQPRVRWTACTIGVLALAGLAWWLLFSPKSNPRRRRRRRSK